MMVAKEEEEEEEYLQETKAMEVPWIMRVVLRAWSMLVVRKDGTLKRETLRMLDRSPVPARSSTPVKGTITRDVTLDAGTGVWARLFTPAPTTAPEPLPVIVFFHGGGFTMLSADYPVYDSFCRELSRRYRAVVLSVNYRKAPQHPFPAAYDDAFSALAWLQRPQPELPEVADVSRCFLMGDSAGGNIAHHVAARFSAAADAMRPVRLAGCVLLFPFFGGEERTAAEIRLRHAPLINYKMCDAAWRNFLPAGASRDHVAANVAAPGGPDLRSLPPVLVAVGGYDCLKEWQVRYVRLLRQAVGKEHVSLLYYPGGIHAFHAFPFLKLTKRLLEDVHQFIRSHSSPHHQNVHPVPEAL